MSSKISSRFYFPIHGLVVGLIFLTLGVFAIIDKNPAGLIVGPIFFIIGSILCFSFKGTILGYENKKFKLFFSFLGVKFGSWVSVSEYHFLTVLEIYLKHESGGKAQGMFISSVYYDYEYRVCLLSSDHRIKTLVYDSKSKKKAITMAETICNKFGIQQVTYKPPTSSHRRKR